LEEDPDHKQDWTITTDEKDSWANRERRRSSVWNKISDISTSPTKSVPSDRDRRGSILSLWKGGKDKDGKDILHHNDEIDDDEAIASDNGEELTKTTSQDKRLSASLTERRGSILSMWKPGKDEHGRDSINHDDEEWKV